MTYTPAPISTDQERRETLASMRTDTRDTRRMAANVADAYDMIHRIQNALHQHALDGRVTHGNYESIAHAKQKLTELASALGQLTTEEMDAAGY